MIKRFRLEQKSIYEKLVIAQRLSDMLEKFLDGRRTPIEIGAEQGGIEEWDDVVVVHSYDSYEHLQIKRQTTDFCTKNPDKNEYLAKRTTSQITPSPELELLTADTSPLNEAPTFKKVKEKVSVLDSAFSSLAKHAHSGTFDRLPEREFQLTLLGANLKIKRELTVNHLDELCQLCRKEGLDLDQLAQREDGPTKRAYLWLTT